MHPLLPKLVSLESGDFGLVGSCLVSNQEVDLGYINNQQPLDAFLTPTTISLRPDMLFLPTVFPTPSQSLAIGFTPLRQARIVSEHNTSSPASQHMH